jgi:ankyrin repeat protein
MASKKGHKGVVELLLKDARVNPADHTNHAIQLASFNGHKEVVELLLQDTRVDPSDLRNRAIQLACKSGNTSIVKLLLQDKRVDPSAENNSSMQLACSNGHNEIVELLLQGNWRSQLPLCIDHSHVHLDTRVNPESDSNNSALALASSNGHKKVVELLLNDFRVMELLSPHQLQSAIVSATHNRHWDVVKLLKAYSPTPPSSRDKPKPACVLS